MKRGLCATLIKISTPVEISTPITARVLIPLRLLFERDISLNDRAMRAHSQRDSKSFAQPVQPAGVRREIVSQVRSNGTRKRLRRWLSELGSLRGISPNSTFGRSSRWPQL